MKKIYIQGQKYIVPVIGVIIKEDKIVLISFLKDKKNKDTIQDFVSKTKKWSVYSFLSRGGFKEKIFDIQNVAEELSYLSSFKADSFKNGEVVTYANMSLLQKSVIGKEINNEQIINLLEEQSPIPIPEDKKIREDIASSLMNNKENLTIEASIAAFPYKKGLYIDVNSQESINLISNKLVISHGESQFIEAFKRAPQIKSLMYMINPKDSFSMKSWPKVLNHFGGKDSFAAKPEAEQRAAIWCYEVFGERLPEVYDFTKSISIPEDYLPWKELAIAKAKDKKFKLDINQVIKGLKYLDSGIMIYAFVSSMVDKEFRYKLPRLVQSKNGLLSEIAVKQYQGLKKGGEPIALVAADLNLPESTFLDYQEEYIAAMEKIPKTPRRYPTVSGKIEGTDYSWESMDMGNPRGWFVGLETNCCQHLHSVGGACVRYAAANPEYSGIFRVMKKGKTIAQSFFWYHPESGDFVMDNIEVLGGEIRDSIIQCYNAFADELEKRKNVFGYKRMTFGSGYSDIDTSTFEKASDTVTLSAMPNGQGVYSDARTQYLIKEF